jgi:hypothetical protein
MHRDRICPLISVLVLALVSGSVFRDCTTALSDEVTYHLGILPTASSQEQPPLCLQRVPQRR